MSAINIPYPDYPGDKKHYKEAATKFNTIAQLITNNRRFQNDIKMAREKFGIVVTEDIGTDFKPRPYVYDNNQVEVGNNSKEMSPELIAAIKEIASRIPLDGDMEQFVKEYVLTGSTDALLLHHLRKSVTVTIEMNGSGTEYINLKLNGPVTLKDIEANWGIVSDEIAKIHPYARDKPKIHSNTANLTWTMYDMRQKGLNNRKITDWLNENIATDETSIFTENGVGKKLDRLEQQIDKSYR